MMDISYIFQRVFQYMQNPNQVLPTASDLGQAAEIEKMRKVFEDIYEAKKEILPEYQGLALDVVCLEIARQILKEQRGQR